MKKLFCILASAALLGACEKSTEVVAPAASPAPGDRSSVTAKEEDTLSKAQSRKPAVSTEKKPEVPTMTTLVSPTP